MPGVEELVIGRLLATSSVTSIVGTRIFPGVRPQGSVLPSIVFNKISGGPLYDDEGEVGLDQDRVQIDSWSTDYTEAKSLSREVRASLSAYFGTTSGVESLYCHLDSERDLVETGSNNAEYLHRVSMDFIILNRSA